MSTMRTVAMRDHLLRDFGVCYREKDWRGLPCLMLRTDKQGSDEITLAGRTWLRVHIDEVNTHDTIAMYVPALLPARGRFGTRDAAYWCVRWMDRVGRVRVRYDILGADVQLMVSWERSYRSIKLRWDGQRWFRSTYAVLYTIHTVDLTRPILLHRMAEHPNLPQRVRAKALVQLI